ncbi:MAG: hypothetical protein ACFFGZ_05890 [Candidatus Thorarchaeota archaeon]
MSIAKYFPFIVIVFVSACAFLAGYVQSNIAEAGEGYREDAQTHERNVDRMLDRLEFISSIDKNQYFEALQLEEDAIFLALKYWWYHDNYTEFERELLLIDMFQKFHGSIGLINSSVVGIIENDFKKGLSTTYEFATKEKYGYNYIITREDWLEYDPIKEYTRAQYLALERNSALSEAISDYPEIEALGMYGADIFLDLDSDNWYDLYRQPIWHEMDKMQDAQELADRYDNYVNRITIGVAITTVATILVAAMASRISDKEMDHDLSVIRADVLKNKALVISERDMLAYLVLVVAVIISVVGLIIPFIGFSP